MAKCIVTLTGLDGSSVDIELSGLSPEAGFDQIAEALSDQNQYDKLNEFVEEFRDKTVKPLEIPITVSTDSEISYVGNKTLSEMLDSDFMSNANEYTLGLLDLTSKTFPDTKFILYQERPLLKKSGLNSSKIKGVVARMSLQNPLIMVNMTPDNESRNNTLIHELTHLFFNKAIEADASVRDLINKIFTKLTKSKDVKIKRLVDLIRKGSSGSRIPETEIYAYLFSDSYAYDYMKDHAEEQLLALNELMRTVQPLTNVEEDVVEEKTNNDVSWLVSLLEKNPTLMHFPNRPLYATEEKTEKEPEEKNEEEFFEEELPFSTDAIPLDLSEVLPITVIDKVGKTVTNLADFKKFFDEAMKSPISKWSERRKVLNNMQLNNLRKGDVINTAIFKYLPKGVFPNYGKQLPWNQVLSEIEENEKLSPEKYAEKVNAKAIKNKITPEQAKNYQERQAEYKKEQLENEFSNRTQNHLILSTWYWEDGKTWMAKVLHTNSFGEKENTILNVPLNVKTVNGIRKLHDDFRMNAEKDENGKLIFSPKSSEFDLNNIPESSLAEAAKAVSEIKEKTGMLKTVKFGETESEGVTEDGFYMSGFTGTLGEHMDNAAPGDYIKMQTSAPVKGKKTPSEWAAKVMSLPGGILVMTKDGKTKQINSNSVTGVIFRKEKNPDFVASIKNLEEQAARFRGKNRSKISEELFKNKAITIYPFDLLKADDKGDIAQKRLDLAQHLKFGDLVNVRMAIGKDANQKVVDAIFSVISVSGKYVKLKTMSSETSKAEVITVDVTKNSDLKWLKNKSGTYIYGKLNEKGVPVAIKETADKIITTAFRDNSKDYDVIQWVKQYQANIDNFFNNTTLDKKLGGRQLDNYVGADNAVGMMLGELNNPNNKRPNLSLDSQWERTNLSYYSEEDKAKKVATLQRGDMILSEFEVEENGKKTKRQKRAFISEVDPNSGKISAYVLNENGRVSNYRVNYDDISEISERLLPMTIIRIGEDLHFYNTKNIDYIQEDLKSKNIEISQEELQKNLKILSEGHTEIADTIRKSYEGWLEGDRNFLELNENELNDPKVKGKLKARFTTSYVVTPALRVRDAEGNELAYRTPVVPTGYTVIPESEKKFFIKSSSGFVKNYQMQANNLYNAKKMAFGTIQPFIKKGDVVTFEITTANGRQYVTGPVLESVQGKNGRIQIGLIGSSEDGYSTKTLEWSNALNPNGIRIFEAFTKNFNRAKAANKIELDATNQHPTYIKYKKDYDAKQKSLESPKLQKSYDNVETIGIMSERLRNLYGVTINMMSNEDMLILAKENNYDLANARAFVSNGEIFINYDKASIAEPLHELTHIILPGLKSKNPELFATMMDKVKEHPTYNLVAEAYPNLSESDLEMEAFCTIFGEYYRNKLITDEQNDWLNQEFIDFTNNTGTVLSELFDSSEINRSTEYLMGQTLEEIMNEFGSSLISGGFESYINSKNPVSLNSEIQSIYQRLLNEGKLKKYCNT